MLDVVHRYAALLVSNNEYVCRQKVTRWGDCFDKPAIREGRGKGGRGRVWRWLGGQWDGRVRLNHKLASRTADAGRGEIRKVVGVIGAIS